MLDFTKRYNRLRQAGPLDGNTRAVQVLHKANAAAAAAASAASAASAAAAPGGASAGTEAVPGVGKKATLTSAEEAKLQQRLFLGTGPLTDSPKRRGRLTLIP